jgi:glutaredoxin 3
MGSAAVSEVIVYTTRTCPYCRLAKDLLSRRSVAYREVDVTDREEFRDLLERLTGGRTVPQVVIGGRPVGGYEELRALEESGDLDRILNS